MSTKKKGGWRILKHGDKIRATDQYKGPFGWRVEGKDSVHVGQSLSEDWHWPHRRWDARLTTKCKTK